MMMTFDNIIRLSLRVSPQSIPRFWTWINVTLLLYSAALLFLLAFRDEGDIAYDVFVDEWYLTYDVVICFVWLIETSLTMVQTWFVVIRSQPSSLDVTTTTTTVYASSTSSSSAPLNETTVGTTTSASKSTSMWSKCHVVEWILAIYFLIDSMIQAMKRAHDEDHTADMVFDVSINFIAYGYIVIAQYIERRQYQQQQQRLVSGYEETHDVEIQSQPVVHNENNLPSSYMVSA